MDVRMDVSVSGGWVDVWIDVGNWVVVGWMCEWICR